MRNIYDLDTPTLLVDLDRMERNIATMAYTIRSGGKKQRPHTKTHKTPEIARLQIEAGATGLTVAKLGEAEVMVDAGFEDLLIANEIVGPRKIERLMALMDRARIVVGVDSREVAEPLSAAARVRADRLGIYLEVDAGLGRAGARSPEEALELARIVSDMPGLELKGVFTYEGQLYKAQDAAERLQIAKSVASQLRELAAAMQAQGTPAEIWSVGSTPGAPLFAELEGVTEIRSGVYVFNDRMQMKYGAKPDDCALTVLTTIISVRPDGKIIVDAGVKALASDCPFPDKTYGEVLGHPELSVAGASEEHGHLQAHGPRTTLRVGDKIRIIPNHACTCVNMHDALTLFRGESVEDVWTIAGRGKIR